MQHWRRVFPVLLVTLTACGSPGTPVPVLGGEQDIAALAGQWEGEYYSKSVGRSGSIGFTLVAGQDTARGQVVMGPKTSGVSQGASSDSTRVVSQTGSQTFQISFVRVTGGAVSGRMDSFQDPDCHCPALTTFQGRLHGDTLSGTYKTRLVNQAREWAGEWWVVRRSLEP